MSSLLDSGQTESVRPPFARHGVSWERLAAVGLLVFAALICFLRFSAPLQEPQEARYAEIPRQMLAEESYVVPVLHGEPYYDKPPLLYWLVMASYTAFGVHDWAARLIACGAAFLCVAVTYGWGRRTVGPGAALAGALILCLSPRFVQLGRMLTMDGLLCLFVISAWALGHCAIQKTLFRPRCWLLSAVLCGLGVLTKGPVALVLVLPPLLGLSWLDRQAARISWRMIALYSAIVGAMVTPWFVAVALRDPSFLTTFFWFHHVRRFVEPFDHAEPFWFYGPVLLLGMLPWTLLLPGMIRSFVRERSSMALLFLLAGLWSLTFFSLAGCKRPSYLLPAMPAFALAIGCYVDKLLQGDSLLHRCLDRIRNSRPYQLAVGAGALAVVFSLYEGMPSYARLYSLRGQVRRHQELYGESKVPVFCYPRRWDSVSFYLKRNDVRVFSANETTALIDQLEKVPEALVFIKPTRGDLLRELPGNLQFVRRGRQGPLLVGSVVHRGD